MQPARDDGAKDRQIGIVVGIGVVGPDDTVGHDETAEPTGRVAYAELTVDRSLRGGLSTETGKNVLEFVVDRTVRVFGEVVDEVE